MAVPQPEVCAHPLVVLVVYVALRGLVCNLVTVGLLASYGLHPLWKMLFIPNEPTQQLAYEDFEQVDQLEMEELDIKWQMAMLSLRVNRFQKKLGHFARECNVKKVDEKGYFAFKISETEEAEQVNGLMAGFESDFAVHAGNATGGVNPAAAETKLGLGFKEYIGSDEVCDLFTPSVFDPDPENRESDLAETQATFGPKSNTSSIPTYESNDFVSCDNSDKSSASETYDFASCVSSPKTNDSFSTVDVKLLPKFDIKGPSLTNGLPSCSFKENVKPPRNLCNKSGTTDRIPCKNTFVRTKKCFVCGSKSHLIKDCNVHDTVDNFPSVVLKAASVPAGSGNFLASVPAGSRNSSASISAASIHAGKHIPAGRFNKPAPFLAGSSVPSGWTNPVARPFFGPTNLSFDNVYWPGIYNHMSMNEGRWGSAVKSSADIGIVDSGFSRSMTGNTDKLDDFVQVKGGTVTFGGGDGKITGKGTIRTSKLNFENVYYVEELQNFNLFSVSKICDKKNKVLFTDDECLVLTKEFQLPDESQDFIALIENQLNKKIKAIRCDNGTEFRNAKLIALCGEKGIKVSITNPHNKTPYELLSGKGKFEGKANDSFLVGYAAHNKPNVQGLGQEWYFDLDYLTDSLGYKRFKTNPPAGPHDTNILAGTQADDSKSECDEQVILVPSFPSNSFSALLPQAEIKIHRNLVPAAGDPAGSIVSTGGVPTGSVPASGVPAGTLTVAVDPVATKRVNTIHPQSQIIRELQTPVQTKSTVQKSKFGENAFISYVHHQNRTNHDDHLHCLFSCFLSQLEPSSVAKALEDPDWVAAMQEEMQQFYN
nr:ribonuclease H-like domain-containing protein [Tanacetum cinerariifolium]